MDQEQDFYSVALAKLLQTTPELGNFIVTFKDVSDELQEETDIKVGIFVLRVGMEMFYIPVVSKDANVYPIDSVYFTSKGKFFPLTKKTVDVIVTSSKMSQGRAAKIPTNVKQNPDLTGLINPPRTGKFVFASTSRLGDFLASMPEYLKKFTMTKVAEEKSVYDDLDKLFGIRDIFAALRPAPGGMAAVTNNAPVSVVTGSATNLTDDDIAKILNNGYAVLGGQQNNRFAISSVNYDDHKFSTITELDGNTDYELMFSNGTSREAFIPRYAPTGPYNLDGTEERTFIENRPGNKFNSVALFTNGDYACSQSFVANSQKLFRTNVLTSLFENVPPVLPKDVEIGDTFAVLCSAGKLIGIFRANRVMMSNLGVELTVSSIAGPNSSVYRINAYRNYTKSPRVDGNDLYLPFSSLVLILGNDVTIDLERSINSASVKKEISETTMLGDLLNLGFDGVEFSVNGRVVGTEANIMERLAVKERIEPTLASTFIKQAKERKSVKLYLSKQAEDFQPGEIPQVGRILPEQAKIGLNGSFMPNISNSLNIGDAQATEATIISELLQTPDMYSLISEYLPDIEECVDKLGRILLLSRVHIDQLAENNDADGVFSFLASLKSVYRMLGENMLKLQELLVVKSDEQEEK